MTRLRLWRGWVQSLPLSLRWFVYLILLRPLVDIFYDLKHVSPFLSPLYIVGVLTPVLIVLTLLSRSLPPLRFTFLDKLVLAWGGLLLANAVVVLAFDMAFSGMEVSLKIILPVLLYFLARKLIRSRKDLDGVLLTFLMSAVVPAFFLLYAILFDPINVQRTRGGIERVHGEYADVVTYGIYISFSFLIAGYAFLRGRTFYGVATHRLIVPVIAVGALAMLAIAHMTTIVVAAVVVSLWFIYATMKGITPQWLAFCLLLAGGVMVLGDAFAERVERLTQRDVAAITETGEIDRFGSGRVGRWRGYLTAWDELAVPGQVLGVPFSIDRGFRGWMLGAVHNDFLRIMFSSGLVGIFIFLIFLRGVHARARYLLYEDRFLVRGAVLILVLYSMTTLPTLYASFLYVCMPIFAYVSLLPIQGHKVRNVRYPTGVPAERFIRRQND